MSNLSTVMQQDREEARGNRLLRVSEVAQHLALGLTKSWQLVNSGEIPSIQIGRARRVRLRDLEDWIERQEVDK